MKPIKQATLIALLLCTPLFCYASAISVDSLTFISHLFFVFNVIVWITSAISIKQLIWHGEHNKAPFHVFNMLLVLVFHGISLSFLLNHRDFYDGYEGLTDVACLKKYFLSTDSKALFKRVIELGFLCNIIYLIRYGKGYYLHTN